MKKIIALLIIMLVVLTACGGQKEKTVDSLDDQVLKAGTLVVGISADYPPFESLDTSNNLVGYDVDMANSLASKIKTEDGKTYVVDFVQMDFSTIISALQTGQVDIGVAAFSYDPARQCLFTSPYYLSAQVIVVQKDSGINSLNDLNGKTVAAGDGTVGYEAASQIPGVTMVSPGDYLQQFGIEEVPHKKYLNDYLKGVWPGSDSRGELYNDDPKLGDARLCGTTASLSGIEAAEYEKDKNKLSKYIGLDLMLHAFLLTQSGIPVLYSGDEIGQLNDYSYHNDPHKKDDSRYLHRGSLDWASVARRHEEGTREKCIFDGIRKLTKLRNSHRVFESAADTWIIETWNDHVLGIGRYYKGEKLIALFNFNDYAETAWMDDEEDYIDMMTGELRPAKAVGIPAYGFVWLIKSFK